MGGQWWGSRKARRFGLAPVFQSRHMPAHPSPKRARATHQIKGDRTTMTKPRKSTKPEATPSRPPVDALQYQKLALSAFDLCDRSLTQLDTLITLASSICRNPAITRDERQRRQKLLELLIETAEQYQQELECDRELFQVIALDAKGVPHSRITARHAASLLAEASQKGGASQATANSKRRKSPSAKSAAALTVDLASRPLIARHQAKH